MDKRLIKATLLDAQIHFSKVHIQSQAWLTTLVKKIQQNLDAAIHIYFRSTIPTEHL